MTTRYRRTPPIFMFIVSGMVLISLWQLSRPGEKRLQGRVTDGDAPVANAVVRLQGAGAYALSDAQGHFSLPFVDRGEVLHVTASAPSYYIAVATSDGLAELHLTLKSHPTHDNPAYAFISPILEPDNPTTCGRCHSAHAQTANSTLPVDEWLKDAHATAATNPRFLSVYNGTTLDGTPGAPTAYRYDAALGVDIPAVPSQGQQDAGAGFRLDFPDETGSCATCHAPILALDDLAARDPNLAEGAAREGITCDFCHKIWDVQLADDGKPSPNLPGVQSLQLLRPPPGEQVFLGPLDDTPGDDIFSPLQNKSQFCAACHTGTFWGVSIYNSFGEWLDSPYSVPETGKTCQDCHMPHTGTTRFVQLPPDVTQYVPERDPQTIFSHRMPGAADMALLQETAELRVEAAWQDDSLHVTVRVTNSGAGHHIPTDNPLRNMILLVTATDANDEPLTLTEGVVIPMWGGVGDPSTGHYAGQPGVLFAKMLADYFTGETPAYAYWRQTRLVSDNRIPALAADVSTYTFRTPGDVNTVRVNARLYMRRAFIELMGLKGWDTPDILMEQVVVSVER